ncbi:MULTISPECIES: OsmC family protein [Spirosoma]|uniref:OsmC family protein n=1 Tax=Spirosoma liriopis TaxID=2937440 RepID=A0ABT0HPN7_9BACT|nr:MULTISPECIES: OsmC family protein [Spirosoma]MCK8494128.1 OsmC family protein [Spirosoma liriopis]UHG89145.1 OsmC family protein [Spirosoma oryzicola]
MATITARIERTPYETHLSTGTQVIVVDEPKEVGGQDRGMRPGELLAGSLASCTAVTVRMYADRKGWSLDSVVIHVDYTYDPAEKRSRFVMKLILNGDLDPEQRLRLREIADRCPIHRALEHPIDFETTLVDEPAQPVANQ